MRRLNRFGKIFRILITAGNTRVPIDLVRAITNIFSGRTGARIAYYLAKCGFEVVLLISSPHLVRRHPNLTIIPFKTFDELLDKMHDLLTDQENPFDAVIHSAAVSDYKVEGVYAPKQGGWWQKFTSIFKPLDQNIGQLANMLEAEANGNPELLELVKKIKAQIAELGDVVEAGKSGALVEFEELDRSGKISSEYPELWQKMIKTVKIISLIRGWGFGGILIMFKLQVGMTLEELLEVATASMHKSNADYIIANCLEWFGQWAHIIRATDNASWKTSRRNLPREIERLLV